MTKERNPWELIADKDISHLVFAFEAVLTEMRTHARGDRTIREWVKRLDSERDDFVRTMLERPAAEPRQIDSINPSSAEPRGDGVQPQSSWPICPHGVNLLDLRCMECDRGVDWKAQNRQAEPGAECEWCKGGWLPKTAGYHNLPNGQSVKCAAENRTGDA